MRNKKSGNKGSKKKISESEEGLGTQRRAGAEKRKSSHDEVSSSESSDEDSDFLADDASLHSDSQSKIMKQKKRANTVWFYHRLLIFPVCPKNQQNQY